MPTAAQVLSRYRLVAVAVAISAAAHAAVMLGLPKRISAIEDGTPPVYEASLQEIPPGATSAVAAPPMVARPRPRPARSPHPKSRIALPPPAPIEVPPPLEPLALPPEPTILADARL